MWRYTCERQQGKVTGRTRSVAVDTGNSIKYARTTGGDCRVVGGLCPALTNGKGISLVLVVAAAPVGIDILARLSIDSDHVTGMHTR